jgi:hypothetical protein
MPANAGIQSASGNRRRFTACPASAGKKRVKRFHRLFGYHSPKGGHRQQVIAAGGPAAEAAWADVAILL